MVDPPYMINADFLQRIQAVVDTALKYKLHIIVNMHHHDSLFENVTREEPRFLSQWNQIADYFKNYPDSVLFEVLNEPHGEITPALWNDLFTKALAEIRKSNPTRSVILGVAEYGGLTAVPQLEVPDDDHLILSIHYYNPFHFTHQGADWVGPETHAWLGTEWNDTEAERLTVVNEFKVAQAFAEERNLPFNVGEFGAFSTADIDSRVRWTTYLARWFESQNMSWAYWEFSAGFGVYDPANKSFLEPLVDALLHNPMPEPAQVNTKVVYQSDFSSGRDGWVVVNQGGASSLLDNAGDKLTVAISGGGTEGWHIQLTKNDIAFTKGKTYQIGFSAKADEARAATFYAGKNGDPWTAYSGYNGVSIPATETRFIFTFTMSEPADDQARLVFDLGKSVVDVSISDILVEEVLNSVTSAENELSERITVFPNPSSAELFVSGSGNYDEVLAFDMQGRFISNLSFQQVSRSIDVSQLPAGLYLLRLGKNGISHTFRVVKE
ncbi:MAG: cellulase family glycosylhydrolase [Imperialibacter sp.]|uniref:cellulase family glycosylhydrolase n=1 Tax=Imperialibacter sp. TaxID=2038411 RepID=UPI0032EEBE26